MINKSDCVCKGVFDDVGKGSGSERYFLVCQILQTLKVQGVKSADMFSRRLKLLTQLFSVATCAIKRFWPVLASKLLHRFWSSGASQMSDTARLYFSLSMLILSDLFPCHLVVHCHTIADLGTTAAQVKHYRVEQSCVSATEYTRAGTKCVSSGTSG